MPRLGTHAAWRDAARQLARTDPEAVDWGWEEAGPALFGDPLPDPPEGVTIPRAFASLAETMMAERSGQGFALAHALLYRLQTRKGLLSNRADPVVARAERIAKEIRRDIHKMHAFVRFRELPAPEGSEPPRRHFAAWFEPDHRIEEGIADFFVNRFGDMNWTIVTPEVTTAYIDGRLHRNAVASVRPDAGDPLEELWTTYYSNIFNPARLKVDAMRAEMPKKYWRNLPEARVIPSLIADARARVTAMQAAPGSPARPIPEDPMPDDGPDLFAPATLSAAAEAAAACTACPLWRDATQVVFGEGPPDASVMVVGEQPGDKEDLAGRPFVGPAGQLFSEAAVEAELDRDACYVTNAVKHFKFVQRGKRRIHQRPGTTEIKACSGWLTQELSLVDPKVVVAMGATALLALTGKGTGILKRRGSVEETRDGRPLLVTVHPSYLLRLPDEKTRIRERAAFTDDLRKVRELLAV
ncbi:MAG: UdgX family uracil-DNA binding protein [Jannaschia sp.]